MKNLTLIFLLTSLLYSCQNQPDPRPIPKERSEAHKLAEKNKMEALMQKHLDAVTNRDLATLKSTMHPDGKMQLLLPGTEIIDGVDGFMKFHSGWFSDTITQWSFETKILNSEVGENLGMVITELTYREAERNGKPYFNRQAVSYVLEKVKGNWYVIKDHCTSIEKSTDKK